MALVTWSGEVEQVTDGDHRVCLRKEIVRLEGDAPLVMVRKHLPDGPTRPPVMLVHGFAQNRYSWHTSVRSMSAWLAFRGWDTWNLELRGHGRSREAGTIGAERFADYVQDVLRAAESLPGPAFWIGHSLGGTALYGAATEAVRQRSDSEAAALPRGVIGIGALYHFGQANRLIGLLGRATHALLPPLPERPDERRGEAEARDGSVLARLQVRTRLIGRIVARLYSITDIAGYTFPISGWWPGSVEPELLRERLEIGFDWTSVKVWQEMSRWATEGVFDYDEAWHETDVPLLVLLGDKDSLMPPADGRVAFDRSGSRDKTLHIFDDWHEQVHWGHLDLILGRYAPRYVWPLIDHWMAERLGEPKAGTI